MVSKKNRLTFQSLMRWGLSALIVVLFSFWFNAAFYTYQKYSDEWVIPPVKVRVFSPKYLSSEEDEQIGFSIENNDPAASANVAFRLRNDGPLLNFPISSGNNELYTGVIQSPEQVYRQINLFFPYSINKIRDMRGRSLGLRLQGKVADSNPQFKELAMGISPIPYAKSLSQYLGLALFGLITWLAKELWEQAKTVGKR